MAGYFQFVGVVLIVAGVTLFVIGSRTRPAPNQGAAPLSGAVPVVIDRPNQPPTLQIGDIVEFVYESRPMEPNRSLMMHEMKDAHDLRYYGAHQIVRVIRPDGSRWEDRTAMQEFSK